jgi:hypothetical protein
VADAPARAAAPSAPLNARIIAEAIHLHAVNNQPVADALILSGDKLRPGGSINAFVDWARAANNAILRKPDGAERATTAVAWRPYLDPEVCEEATVKAVLEAAGPHPATDLFRVLCQRMAVSERAFVYERRKDGQDLHGFLRNFKFRRQLLGASIDRAELIAALALTDKALLLGLLQQNTDAAMVEYLELASQAEARVAASAPAATTATVHADTAHEHDVSEEAAEFIVAATRAGFCFKCMQQGHPSSACTKELVCRQCLQPGHSRESCKEAVVCIKCRKPGHMAKNCHDAKKRTSVSSGADSRHGGAHPFKQRRNHKNAQPAAMVRVVVVHERKNEQHVTSAPPPSRVPSGQPAVQAVPTARAPESTPSTARAPTDTTTTGAAPAPVPTPTMASAAANGGQHHQPMTTELPIEGVPTAAVIDTGSALSLVTSALAKQFVPRSAWDKSKISRLVTADGSAVHVQGAVALHLGLTGDPTAEFWVVDGLPAPVLLGNDLLAKFNTTIDFAKGKAVIGGKRLPVTVASPQLGRKRWSSVMVSCAVVRATRDTVIPARSAAFVPVDGPLRAVAGRADGEVVVHLQPIKNDVVGRLP